MCEPWLTARLLHAPFPPECSLVSRNREHLQYLNLLGFRVLYIWDWSRAAEKLGQPLPESSYQGGSVLDRLQAMQTANLRALARLYSRVKRRVAAEVCAAAGAPVCNECGRPLPADRSRISAT